VDGFTRGVFLIFQRSIGFSALALRLSVKSSPRTFTHQVGGEAIAKKHEAARYTAICEIDSPGVLMSPVHEEPDPHRLQGALRRIPDAG